MDPSAHWGPLGLAHGPTGPWARMEGSRLHWNLGLQKIRTCHLHMYMYIWYAWLFLICLIILQIRSTTAQFQETASRAHGPHVTAFWRSRQSTLSRGPRGSWGHGPHVMGPLGPMGPMDPKGPREGAGDRDIIDLGTMGRGRRSRADTQNVPAARGPCT
jgi:hypothetical protein